MKPVLFLLGLVACGDRAGAPDGAAASCQELADRFSAAIEPVDRSCNTVADCAAPGGPIDTTCNCTPALPEYAVNRDAYQSSAAAELAAQFTARCADDPEAPAICDYALSDLDCVEGTCRTFDNSCLEVDAGAL